LIDSALPIFSKDSNKVIAGIASHCDHIELVCKQFMTIIRLRIQTMFQRKKTFSSKQRWRESHFQTLTPLLFHNFEFGSLSEMLQICESDAGSNSSNNQCNRNSAMFVLKQWHL